tara:strand:+ start:999 stop:1412 length:414 start_codon:yes stop_codon:yes gene_type:complete
MEKIFSKTKPELLLHIINRCEDISEKREDLTPEAEFLQVSTFKMKRGKTFQAHYHLEQNKKTTKTQESWVVIKGAVKVFLYDIDKSLLAEKVLRPGDCSITLHGGHNYLALEDGTLIYEYKTGPYNGRLLDKGLIHT